MKIMAKIVFLSFVLLILSPATYAADEDPFEAPGFRKPNCNISADQPHVSKFVEVLGHSMHYVEAGDPDGEVFLFLHGTPTYSYIWRNVMPQIVNHVPNARVIAVDAIGMGFSERPDDLYFSFEDHVSHIEGFVEALGLEDITLVSHDWGSGWGLTFADRNPEKVRATAFLEALLPPDMPFTFEKMEPFARDFIGALRTPGVGEHLVINEHVFLGAGFLGSGLCWAFNGGPAPAIYDAYLAPWLEPASRRVLLQIPRDLPVDGVPENVTTAVESHIDWLTSSNIPKLLMHVEPGAVIPPENVAWLEDNLQSLSSVSLGPGIHFVQESNPEAVGRTTSKWYLDKVDRPCSINGSRKFGTSGDDSLVSQGHFFLAGDGDDRISAAACGTRIVFGGRGDDSLTAGNRSVILGGSGNDFLDGTFSDRSVLLGGVGSDVFWLGAKTIAFGNNDVDNFIFFGSQGRAYGGEGKDRFVIAIDGNLPAINGHNTILDFESGDDSIVFNGFGNTLTDIDDLTLMPNEHGIQIGVDNKIIAQLYGVHSLTADDVVFE